LAREVQVLRRCTEWLQRLERGESVVVNLRNASSTCEDTQAVLQS
jgi:hypothetical protein